MCFGMKKITMLVMIAIVLSINPLLVHAEMISHGYYYTSKKEFTRLDKETVLITYSFTNTTKKTIKNIVLKPFRI